MTTTEMPEVETAAEPNESEKVEECSAFEDMKVDGEELLAKVRDLIHEGNVRRVIIKNGEGTTLIEIPLTLGVAGAVILPTLAAVGTIAASSPIARSPSNEESRRSRPELLTVPGSSRRGPPRPRRLQPWSYGRCRRDARAGSTGNRA